MTEKSTVTYRPRGPAAFLQAALGQTFDPLAPVAPSVQGDCAVVDIVGPLVHHFAYGMDSYDAIVERVRAACATPAAEVVLRIDSPGGDVYGCFEAARTIRAVCAGAGKRLCSYISGAGASAAFALACAGDQIYASSTSCVGSIGIIDAMISVARQDERMGIDTAMITSGERKADGNPHVPLSKEAMAAHQAHVNDLAVVFFAWVAERRGMSPETIKALNADVFVGVRAAEVGLIDQVADFAALQEIRKGGTIDALARTVPQGNSMKTTFDQVKAMFGASKFTEAMAALAAMAEEGEGEDKDKARKAMKKMLADDKPSEDKPAAAADPPAEEKPAAVAASATPAASFDVVEAVRALQAANVKREADAKRTALLASRPDLMADPAIKAALENASVETIEATIKIVPKAALTPPPVVTPTVGATAGKPVGLPEAEAAALKARMGLGPDPTASVHRFGDADVIVFGATDEQAARIAAERGF